MAAESGVFPDRVINKPEQGVEKKLRLATLMEKLRARNPQHKSWVDKKLSRIPNMTEKRHFDTADKPLIQKCLDTLQKAIKVCNNQSMLERLESIARQVGLNYNTTNDVQVFISSDMFYIEVQLDKVVGKVKDVKIVHQGDPVSCPELTEILQNGQFDEFVTHLEGLQKIYSLSGDKKIKTKAYLALQSIEKDLNSLAQLQSSINGVAKYIHKSPLGILLPRKGGLPMELMYFVSPYDLLDKLTKTAHPLTVEAITEYNLGQRVTICMEPGPPNKLQTMPLMTVNKMPDGKSLPSFTDITNVNSHLLPACFTLVLKQAIPVALSVVQKIQSITHIEFGNSDDVKPLIDLLMQQYSNGQILNNQKKLHVSLPDQHHVYYLNGVNGGSLDQPGIMVSTIPFIHPTNVPNILNHLRQQLLFNTVVSNMIRPHSKPELSHSIVCELTTISMQQLMVTFEHPAHDAIVTVEMDLSDITSLRCRVNTSSELSLCTDDFASKIFQRCMSVPVTVRSILKHGKDMLEKATVEAVAAMQPPVLPPVVKPRPPPYIPPPQQQIHPPAILPNNHPMDNYPRPPPYSDIRSSNHEMVSPPGSGGGVGDRVEKMTPLLATLLDHDGEQPSDMTDSPMLSRLLEEHPQHSQPQLPQPQLPQPQPPMTTKPQIQQKRVRKRKSASDVFSGRSPKHRISDSSSGMDRMDSFDMDNSSSPFDAGGGGGGMGSNFQASGSLGSVIDLTEDAFGAESNLKKLADSVDSLIPRGDMSRQNSIQDSELTALLAENDLGGRSVISRSSPQSSKNEKASISLEGLLSEVGDNDEAQDPILANRLTASLLSAKPGNQRGERYNSTLDVHLRNELFGEEEDKAKTVQQLLSHRVSQHDLLDSKYPPYGKGSLKVNSDIQNEKKEFTGIFEKLENLKGEQLSMKKEKIELGEMMRSEVGVGNQVMKLKLSASGLRSNESRISSSSPAYSSEPVTNKKSGSCTYDFRSDESDDEPPPTLGISSERLSMTVYSQSPTRLQISNKSKNSHDALLKKSDKYKRKEAKYSSKGESVKRKKLKEESKKERKKRKLNESNRYVQPVKETLYRSVESDERTVTKLKIRVAKEPPVVTPISPEKEKPPAGEMLRKQLVEKFVVSRQDSKETTKERPIQKSPHRSKLSANSQGSSESGKSDPKLAKATIRLKPLHIPHSGSSVTVNAGQKSAGITGKTSGEIKLTKSSNSSKTLLSGNRTSSPSLSASNKNSGSGTVTNSGKISSPNISGIGRTTSSPNLTGAAKTASPNISSKNVLSPSLSATGKISSPSLSGSGKINSPSLSGSGKINSPSLSSGKTSSPVLSASGKTSSPNLGNLGKSSSLNKTYNSANKGSGAGNTNKSSSSKSSSLSSSKSASSLNSSSRSAGSSSNSSSKSSNLSKSSSTSTMGNQNTSMSMSAYLPNAPSASKVARLPPIPKLSSSQSSSQASSISHSSALHSPPSQSSSSAYSSSSSNTLTQSNSASSTSATSANETASSNKSRTNVEPMVRGRRGSLSAVIDKLTKATGSSGSVTENTESSSKTGNYSEGTTNSRDPRTFNKNENKLERNASVSSEKVKSDFPDRKAMRPDSINIEKYSNKPRNFENSVGKPPVQKSSPTMAAHGFNKVTKGDYTNVNKRPVNNMADTLSNQGKSRSSSESVALSSSRINNLLASSKTSRVASPTSMKSSPGILKTGSNSQFGPIIDENNLQKSSKSNDSIPKRERSHTPTNSLTREDPRLVQSSQSLANSTTSTTSNVNKSEPEKSKSIQPVPKTVSPIPQVLDLSISEKNIPSPKITNHGSPFVPKFNGEIHKEEKEHFKVPTPKPQTPEKEAEEFGSPKCRSVTPNKNNMSPRSDASSPENNGLVIDCDGTPTSNDGPSPKPRTDNPCSVKLDLSDEHVATAKKSSLVKTKSSSSLKEVTPPDSATSPISNTNSPCEIDDELMDQALLGLDE
ncbi:mediator of RNA polymerase II transcription subunit 1 isoform X1 [Patella vulgata]|uniref:mediator of RNA polymerase II transcription subunit 1 isoform X1 n=2 Tax=Patella vulgata TaxID=6465 RepID=UPI0021804084|nr:mediator of RNA polymerase II transcription subunit 1 isoform X1 [Patella vulgata]